MELYESVLSAIETEYDTLRVLKVLSVPITY